MKYIQRAAVFAATVSLIVPATAHAAPGLGEEVYGAEVEKGEAEVETIYGRLDGGADDGEDVLKLEAAYGVTDRLRLGLIGELEKEPLQNRRFEAVGVEAIYELGRVGGVNLAAYGEYEVAFDGADKVETKLLMQRRAGPVDLRLNLIAEKELKSGAEVELGYAASADVETFEEVRLGVQAFGELGTFDHLAPRAEHFAGPVAKVEIEGLGPEMELQAGYLFALGAARDDSDGQFRLALELEF
ncbi:hypothetical protein ACFO0A_00090 [Novosphingobium tardum]|uniref:Uncharacterized protein n=1 Tax=Novosphingobium tardum TaxID=1538021 RepID=A0ABV8RK56_9SPHN